MQGLMMRYPLTLHSFFDRNQRLFPRKEVVSRTSAGLHRYTYSAYGQRVRLLAGALADLGIRPGDRVGTFGWNTHRHLEFYYAVPCMGAVLHTVNIRLSPEQITFIINDAGDRVLAVDRDLLPLVEGVRDHLRTVEHVIVLDDVPAPGVLSYESLLAAARPMQTWPEVDEWAAAGICYSSGTTGNPKGVVYSHRSIYLHSMSLATADNLSLSEADRILPVVPMFHANAWGLPHAAVAVGASLILPGPTPTPGDILSLIKGERATLAAGVPTVWMGLLAEARQAGPEALSTLRVLPCGGAAPPPSLIAAFRDLTGTPLTHSWGMTETSPVATMGHPKASLGDLTQEEELAVRSRQGLPVLGLDLTIMDDTGQEVPWDGTSYGEIVVRGPFVAGGYLHADTPDRFVRGWFRTGDVATIDPEGYVQIVDRTKDLIKSGGEWISSQELESLIMGHPDVAEAVVIAVPHQKWGERPLALVVPHQGRTPTADDILDIVRGRVARFAVPDRVEFIDAIPHTSVGKFDKKLLRERYASPPPPVHP